MNVQSIKQEFEMEWMEYAFFAATFALGAFMAWTLYPYIHPPTLTGVCSKWIHRLV